MNKFIWSIVCGILVWFVMNVIVLLLSNIPQRQLHLQSSLVGMAILIVPMAIGIGLPVLWGAERYFSKNP